MKPVTVQNPQYQQYFLLQRLRSNIFECFITYIIQKQSKDMVKTIGNVFKCEGEATKLWIYLKVCHIYVSTLVIFVLNLEFQS